MSELTRDLVKRYTDQIAQRQTVQQMWDAITRYVQPYRGRFFRDQKHEQSINWFETREIRDSTAPSSARNLASRLHGDITSPAIRWFDIRFRDEKLNANKAVAQWVQDVSDRIYFELQDSNFDLEINKVYQDLVGPGTAVLTLEEKPGQADWNGLLFQSVPLKEAYFEEDLDGGAIRFYRALEWTPQQILRKFGDDAPEAVKEMDKAGNTQKQEVLFAVYPRNNKIMAWGDRLAPSRRPWAWCYIHVSSTEMIGKEGGYYDMPAFVGRWDTTNSSQWGNSPSMIALADILSLNRAIELTERRAEKTVDPPMLAEERANINQLNIGASTVTVVRNIGGVAAMPIGGTPVDMDQQIERYRDNIRNYYVADTLDFPAPQGTPMSATEAQIRYERLQRYLSATLGQIRTDVLNPAIERAFNMLIRAGQFPPPPEAVPSEGADLDIVYLGSLSRAQQIDGVGAIERTMAAAANAGAAWPEALDTIDAVKGVREIGKKLNAPVSIMRDQGEVEALQEQRRAQQEAAQQAMLAEQQGQAMQAQGAGREALSGS